MTGFVDVPSGLCWGFVCSIGNFSHLYTETLPKAEVVWPISTHPPPHPCHVLEIVSDPDHCQQKVSSAWGDFTFTGDTVRLAIGSSSFLFFFLRWVFRCVLQEYVVFWSPAVWKCEISDLYNVCGTNMNVCALC